jgi:hypothetical protein
LKLVAAALHFFLHFRNPGEESLRQKAFNSAGRRRTNPYEAFLASTSKMDCSFMRAISSAAVCTDDGFSTNRGI